MIRLSHTTQYVSRINKEIEEEIEKCIFRLNLETLLTFISIIKETEREEIIKEEVFDYCNNKLINLQENYKNNITEEQQQQINELQNTINYFYHNPKEVIDTIIGYSSKLDKLKNHNVQIKEKISLITREIEQETKSQATSKTISLENYYIKYINVTNDSILLLQKELDANKNAKEYHRGRLKAELNQKKKYNNNILQIKELKSELNQQSLQLNEELKREKEQGNQENIKLIEEKMLENRNQLKLNQESISEVSNFTRLILVQNNIQPIRDLLSELQAENKKIVENIKNEKTILDKIKNELKLEQQKAITTNISKTFYVDSVRYEDYIKFIEKNLYQNQEILKINTIQIEKIKNMNLKYIYRYKAVEEPLSKILSKNSAITKNSGQGDFDNFKMTIPFALYAPSGQQLFSLKELEDLETITPFVPPSTSAGGESEHASNLNMDNAGDSKHCLEEMIKIGESLEIQQEQEEQKQEQQELVQKEMIKIGESLEIQQEQEKQEFIQKELYKCMCYFKLETLTPFVSLTEESKINQKLKEEIVDYCNNKLINLQENYQGYITEEQQKHINYLQQKIEDFNKNPQLIINAIKNHITNVNELEQQQEQIKIEIAILKHELNQEKKLLTQEERALNKEVNTPDKITSYQEYYTYLENQKQHEKDNKLNQPETMPVERTYCIKVIKEKINKNSALLRRMRLEIKEIQDMNLEGLIEYLTTQDRISKKIDEVSKNLYKASTNLNRQPSSSSITDAPNIFATPNTPIATNTSETSSVEMLKSLFEFGIHNPNISTTPNTPIETNTSETSSLEIGTKRKIEQNNPYYPAKR